MTGRNLIALKMKNRELTTKLVTLSRKKPVPHDDIQGLLDNHLEATKKEYHRIIENVLIDCVKSGQDIYVALVRITELKQTLK